MNLADPLVSEGTVVRLVAKSWVLLLYCEFVMRFRSFRALTEIVRNKKTDTERTVGPSGILCHAMDFACVFYFKRVMCLQRSAATTLLLRSHGWEAEMVIGAQILPFKSHAWVEIEKAVVNDKPYVPEIYLVLERC